ncbi:TGF-beta receptor type-1-like [Paramuricea clavata]|uniref:TGF-beta receptor type-1-like n=1 Tax=Paramuricea clavata TaxID=317549 RepID=A0A6S7K0M0_PARCT|nr:TGF-beta receptor type-1-like [Paramuricea clavata]
MCNLFSIFYIPSLHLTLCFTLDPFTEVLGRWFIVVGNPSEEYQLPYYEKVQSDPSIEEMKETVCNQKYRPSFPKTWYQNPIMKGMTKIMQECWYECSAARLPALRVKKSLINLKCDDPVDV